VCGKSLAVDIFEGNSQMQSLIYMGYNIKML